MELLIKGVRIVDKDQDFLGDLYIKDSLIEDFGSELDQDCQRIDGDNLVLMPAFIDLHAHFRDPGFTHKEDLESGARSGLKGGYTYVNLMGNTDPICSTMETVEYVLDKAKELDLLDLHQTVSITKNFDGKSLDHLDQLDSRVRVISDDGLGVKSNLTMYQALKKAKEKDLLVLSHAEDEDLTPIDYRMSENIISFRDIYLAQVTGARLHLSHVSTKEAIEAIRIAKTRGQKSLSCDVTPHHISLWDRDDLRVNPPIRRQDDVEEIIRGIVDGTVDSIATDHAPHTEEEKLKGSPGYAGLETAFPVSYSSLVKPGHIDLKRLSELMAANPALILGLNRGRIKKGWQADLVLVDLEKEIKVESDELVSKSKNTAFAGMKFYGQVQMTIRKGQIKYKRREEEENDNR